MMGRIDSQAYKTGLAKCFNYLLALAGYIFRRPGTYFVFGGSGAFDKCRLIPFEFSTTQAYVIQMFGNSLQFFKNHEIIFPSGGGPFPYSITSPYNVADIFKVKFTQSADVLYLTHPFYPPYKLERLADDNWVFTQIAFIDGPYFPLTTLAYFPSAGFTGNFVYNPYPRSTSNPAILATIQPSANSGAISLTATCPMFQATDVGRVVRLGYPANIGGSFAVWGVVQITAVASSTSASATVLSEDGLGAITATSEYQFGLWSNSTGYPSTVVFHEDRLVFGGTYCQPERFDGSNVADYENSEPSDTFSGTIIPSNAYNFALNSNDVNTLQWMVSDEQAMIGATYAGEWSIRASAENEAITPTNISAKRATSFGSEDIQGVQAGKATIFVQKSGLKVRELIYSVYVQGYRAAELTEAATHIAGPGFIQIAYQKLPHSIIWGLRSDGVLAACTYDRDENTLKSGWSRHVLGGFGDAAGNPPIVESICVIPSPDGNTDELWMVVNRYINGAMNRSIEYLTEPFNVFSDTMEQRDAFFVDCGQTLNNPLAITSYTLSNPLSVQLTAHGFSTGDSIQFDGISGLLPNVDHLPNINGNFFTITVVDANNFTLDGVDGTKYSAPTIAGEARKRVTTISNLFALIGQTVSVLADGGVQNNKVVQVNGGTGDGFITLDNPAAVVQVGLPYISDIQTLRLDSGSADGTSIGKTRRTHRMGIMLQESLGLKIGMSFDDLDQVLSGNGSVLPGHAPSLFTGIISELIESDYNFDNMFCIRQDQPLPSTVLALMPQLVEQDRG